MVFEKKPLILWLIMMLILCGCSAKGKRNKPLGRGPDRLYAKGLSLFNRGKHQRAMDVFKDVGSYYPESPEALRAETKIADCYFFRAEYEEAVAIYEEFRKLHPYHDDIPYIRFQIGEAYFKQMTSSDRDQTSAREALSNFRYLVENYPPSIFTKAAEEKIPVCRRSLAEHEFLVGRFYYKKKNYQGAAARFERILEMYSDTDLVPKTLFYLGMTFINLSLKDKARAAFLQITDQYPTSEYASKAEAILRTEWNETEAGIGLERSRESGSNLSSRKNMKPPELTIIPSRMATDPLSR